MLFSKEELKLIPDTLSLLYGTKLQDETGSITKYSFFHPSIQELFAAIHISRRLAYIPPPPPKKKIPLCTTLLTTLINDLHTLTTRASVMQASSVFQLMIYDKALS